MLAARRLTSGEDRRGRNGVDALERQGRGEIRGDDSDRTHRPLTRDAVRLDDAAVVGVEPVVDVAGAQAGQQRQRD